MSVIMLDPAEFLALSECLRNKDIHFWSNEIQDFRYDYDQLILDMILLNAYCYKNRYSDQSVNNIINNPKQYLEFSFNKTDLDNAQIFTVRCKKDRNILSTALYYYLSQVDSIDDAIVGLPKEIELRLLNVVKLIQDNLLVFVKNDLLFKQYEYGIDNQQEKLNKDRCKYTFSSYRTIKNINGNSNTLHIVYADNVPTAIYINYSISQFSNNYPKMIALGSCDHYLDVKINRKKMREIIVHYIDTPTVKVYGRL